MKTFLSYCTTSQVTLFDHKEDMFREVCLNSVVAMIYAVVIDRGHENIY